MTSRCTRCGLALIVERRPRSFAFRYRGHRIKRCPNCKRDLTTYKASSA